MLKFKEKLLWYSWKPWKLQKFSLVNLSSFTVYMLFKLSVMLLSSAPKFSLFRPSYVPLCPIMLHKMMLPESEDQPISLTTFISKQLRALHFTFSTTAQVIMLIILYIVLFRISCDLIFCIILNIYSQHYILLSK